MIEIAPSVLAANPLYVGRDVRRLLDAGANLLHLDIMDGHFVPNLSFGPAMVSALRDEFPQVSLDVHLMIAEPGRFIGAFIQAGADEITIHSEIGADLAPLLKEIRDAGLRAGLSIKPATPSGSLAPYLDMIDLVLLMSVEPGFGGQQLMMDTLPKLGELRQAGFRGTLSVDGGVNQQNASLVIDSGATRLVMGTAAFRSDQPEALFAALRKG